MPVVHQGIDISIIEAGTKVTLICCFDTHVTLTGSLLAGRCAQL